MCFNTPTEETLSSFQWWKFSYFLHRRVRKSTIHLIMETSQSKLYLSYRRVTGQLKCKNSHLKSCGSWRSTQPLFFNDICSGCYKNIYIYTSFINHLFSFPGWTVPVQKVQALNQAKKSINEASQRYWWYFPNIYPRFIPAGKVAGNWRL